MANPTPDPEYRNLTRHPVTLASGRQLAPGEAGPSPMTHSHDQALRDNGALGKVPTKKENQS